MTRFACTLALAALVGPTISAADSQPVAKPGVPLEFVVVPDGTPARLQLQIEIDGKPLSTVWDETFAKLAGYVDRDGNGTLDEKEATRLPDPVAFRQALGTGYIPPLGSAPAFAELDADKNGKVTTAEVAAFYRNAGLGSGVVGIGKMPHGAPLTSALLAQVDANKDGKTTEAEWKALATSLARLDLNEDELIGISELVPKATYPGAAGSVLLSANPGEITRSDIRFAFPIAVLPPDATDDRWAQQLVLRRKPLQKPTVEELLGTRKSAGASWTVRLGAKQPPTEHFSVEAGNIRIDGWVAEGKLPATFDAIRKQLVASLDRTEDVEERPAGGRRRGGSGLGWLTPIADRNSDGKLDRAELDAWLELQEQVVRGHVLVSLIDGGRLFELLDVNHDGALSPRELRSAWARLTAAGCTANGEFDPKKLPQVVLASVSRGYATRTETRRGPAWFQAMDRNGDGDVSRKEFTGDPETFDRLDTDKDGLLSPTEAAKAAK